MGLTDVLCPGLGQAMPPKPSCPVDWVTWGCRRQRPQCKDPCLVLMAQCELGHGSLPSSEATWPHLRVLQPNHLCRVRG